MKVDLTETCDLYDCCWLIDQYNWAGNHNFFIWVNIPLKCIYLQRGYLECIKDTKCMSTNCASRNKNSEQSAYNQMQSAIFFFAWQTGLPCFFFWKKSVIFFFVRSLFLCVGFCTLLYGTAVQYSKYQSLFKNMISVHTLERLLMHWLLVITFDTLLIKFMQTAQLTYCDGIVYTEFFAALFFSDVVKRTKLRLRDT